MKSIATLLLFTSLAFGAAAQTTITNGGFELWGDTSPGLSTEPTGWYSNKSGSAIAQLANPTCSQENTPAHVHSGTYSVKIQTITYLGIEVVNGVVTTGVVDAPSTTKDSGYIGTVNYSNASDDRRMPFTGRPDSLVGWYQYTSGGTGEQAKIRAILHTGDYFDPETPTNSYHPVPTANKIGDVTFLGPMASVATWTRFSVPFTYVSALSPAYIMINVTPSANQGTTVSGSILWLDDLAVVYAPTVACGAPTGLAASAITTTGATLNWSEPTGSTGSEYTVSTSSVTPTGSGTATTTLTYAATGLTAHTTYYAFVRNNCSTAGFSSWVSTAFTTNPVGVNTVTTKDFDVTVFPNPVKDALTIKINGATSNAGRVQLMDMSGRLISTTAADASTVNLDMNGLPSGIYVIRYVDSEHTQTVKINKQ